jgi:prepilin peptidase CpaA
MLRHSLRIEPMMSLSFITLFVIFPAAMAYAAASDLVSMTIPNWLCLVLVAAFALCAGSLGLSWSAIGWHVAAGGLMLVVCFGLFAAGWVGGGDAKLVAATALWFGFEQLMPYLLLSAVLGGVLTLGILFVRSRSLPALAQQWSWAQRLHTPTEGVPYGIALAVAALMQLPETGIWHAAIGA